MDIFETIQTRRSIRKYTGAPVPCEDLEKIVDAGRLAFAESLPTRPPAHHGHAADPASLAARARELGEAEVGLAVEARPRRGDTAVSIALDDPRGRQRERRLVFLAEELGRGRAAIAAAAVLLSRLRGAP